jgi:hypothetical protein
MWQANGDGEAGDGPSPSHFRSKVEAAKEEVSELRRASLSRDAELAALRVQVEAGAAARSELRESQAATERVRADASRAHRVYLDAQKWHEDTLAAAHNRQTECASARLEVQALTQELIEAQEDEKRRSSCYWDDAPFLMASADVVRDNEAEIAQCNEKSSEIQDALEREKRLHEEALWDAREAAVLGDDVEMLPRGLNGFAESGLVSPSPQSLLLERSPSSPRQASPVRAALVALDSENERLRKKLRDLRTQCNEVAPPMTTTLPSPKPNFGDSFDVAVAGTGARVVDQMKQALHDDVALLRSLHQVKQELDKERRRERRMHAALERRLAAFTPAYAI